MTLKLSENPPVIWPEDKTVRDFKGSWWVAHTKARNEKALAWDLLRKNIQYFLPLTWKVHKNKNRTLRSLIPLFSGYLFFCGVEEDRLEVLRTNRVAGLINVKDADIFINELFSIEKALVSGVSLKPHKFISAGQRCRVVAGPLLGAEGIVVKEKDQTRLIMQVDILGQATSVEIEYDMIEIIE